MERSLKERKHHKRIKSLRSRRKKMMAAKGTRLMEMTRILMVLPPKTRRTRMRILALHLSTSMKLSRSSVT